MLYTTVLSIIFIAILFSLILSYAFKRSGPGPVNGLLFFFLTIFLFSWAVGGWIEPVKPYQIEYPWLSYFFIGLFIMLLLGALLPPTPPTKNTIPEAKVEGETTKEREVAGVKVGLFFWVMIITLVIFGIARWA